MTAEIKYKILNTKTGEYSRGAIESYTHTIHHMVRWNKRGKEWASYRLLNMHLEKYIKLVGHIPAEWQIIEVKQEPLPMPEWVQERFIK